MSSVFKRLILLLWQGQVGVAWEHLNNENGCSDSKEMLHTLRNPKGHYRFYKKCMWRNFNWFILRLKEKKFETSSQGARQNTVSLANTTGTKGTGDWRGKCWYNKVKVIPRQAEVAQEAPGRLRPRIFLTFRHYKVDNLSKFFCTRDLGVLAGSTARG